MSNRINNNKILNNYINSSGSLDEYQIIGTPVELKPVGDNVEKFEPEFLKKVIKHLKLSFDNPKILYNGYYNNNINYNNFNSYRLFVMSIIYDHLDYEKSDFNDIFLRLVKHLNLNLYSDGSTFDFIERNCILYHEYNMIALVKVVEILEKKLEINIINLISHGLTFMKPYVNGTIKHIMFLESKLKSDVNHHLYGVEYNKDLSNKYFLKNIEIYLN